MRVTCPACNTPFAVRDDLVRGRIVSFRCKRCRGTIDVDGTALGAAPHGVETSPSAPPPPHATHAVSEPPSGTERLSRVDFSQAYPSAPPPPEERVTSTGDEPPRSDAVATPRVAVALGHLLAPAEGEEDLSLTPSAMVTVYDDVPVSMGDDEEQGPVSLSAYAEEVRSAPPPPPMLRTTSRDDSETVGDLRKLGEKSKTNTRPPRRPDGPANIDDLLQLSGGPLMPNLGAPSLLGAPSASVAPAPTPSTSPAPAKRSSGAWGWVAAAGSAALIGWFVLHANAPAAPPVEPVAAPTAEPTAPVVPTPTAATPTPTAPPTAVATAAPTQSATPAPTAPAATAATTTAAATAAPPAAAPNGKTGTPKAVAAAATPTPTPAAPTANVPPPPPEAAAADVAPEFNKEAAVAALGSAAASAGSCKTADGPGGIAKVAVRFAPSGRVTTAVVEGPPFAGTPEGSCIAGKFRGARVPPFSGEMVTVRKTVSLN